jgi:hypothetical protein
MSNEKSDICDAACRTKTNLGAGVPRSTLLICDLRIPITKHDQHSPRRLSDMNTAHTAFRIDFAIRRRSPGRRAPHPIIADD